jgi:perosamine synthetase
MIIPYGKQTLDQNDIDSVIQVLQENNYLTTGPRVEEFENQVGQLINKKYAVAVNSGTAALHLAMIACNIEKNDEVIVTAMSFVASANCILYCGGTPVFCDIQENTLNIDPDKIEDLITENTKAIICVDFAGQLCDYSKIKNICERNNLFLIEDACHAFGCTDVGKYADIVAFSFHPVKHITTGEGGMALTNNENLYKIMKTNRSHGIDKTSSERESYYYEMTSLGYNYRISDILCALGISQCKKIQKFVYLRQNIADIYTKELSTVPGIELLTNTNNHSYHLFIIKIFNNKRDYVYNKLKENGINANVHYLPIYYHQYYQNNLKYSKGICPIAEKVYEQIISIPIYPNITREEIQYVIKILKL